MGARAATAAWFLIATAASAADAPGGVGLEVDPAPRRYDLRLAIDHGEERRVRVGWADGADLRLALVPPQARRWWSIGLVAGLGEHDDGDLRLRTADFALAARAPLAEGDAGAIAVEARYGVIAMLASDAALTNGAALGDGGAIAITGEHRWDRARVGVALGYVAWRFTSAVDRLDASGWIHGPQAALTAGWRW